MKKYKKNIIFYTSVLILSTVVVLLFSSSTSPLFEIIYSDYYNNPASTGFLVGKCWTEGIIPYRDLYVVNGPLYYLFQRIGWSIGGRDGVFLLQCFSIAVGLLYLFRSLCILIEEKYVYIVMILSVIYLCATLNGGNSSIEFCFPASSMAVYYGLECCRNERKNIEAKLMLILGVLMGIVIMIQMTGGSIVYGVCFFAILRVFLEKKNLINRILFFLLGIVIVTVPFCVYFFINHGLTEMLQCSLIESAQFMYVEAFSLQLVIHKLVKSIPVLLLMLASILFNKIDILLCRLLCCLSAIVLIFSVTGQGYWYQYIPVVIVFGLLVGFALKNMENISIKCIIGVGIILLSGVIFSPMKHYYSFVTNENMKVYNLLIEQMNEYQKKTGDKGIFLVDVPAFVYLETDNMPTYYYFAQHSEYSKTNLVMQQETTNYMVHDCRDNLAVIQSSSGTYMVIGNYVLSNNYGYDRTMLYVYEFVEDEEEHIHAAE